MSEEKFRKMVIDLAFAIREDDDETYEDVAWAYDAFLGPLGMSGVLRMVDFIDRHKLEIQRVER